MLALGGCKRGGVTPTEAPTPTGGDDPICGELAIVPAAITLEGGQAHVFDGTGGTGVYTFTLTGAMGGELDGGSGLYVAPPDPVSDAIVLRDQGCPGSAIATVTTVPALLVEPASVVVPVGAVVEPEITGGSGSWTCELTASSGAVLDGCTYTAGGQAGIDAVEVVDDVTGATRTITVEVIADLVIAPTTAPGLAIPLDMGFVPTFVGGSGSFDLVSSGPEVVVDPADPGRLIGAEAGEATITATDRFVPSIVVEMPVRVLEPVTMLSGHDGLLDARGNLLREDLDGDGRPELIASLAGISVDGPGGGWVGVYPGTTTGFAASPTLELADPGTDAALGAGLAVGDVDADGKLDLVVGAPGAQGRGEVRLHNGVAGGGFDPVPVWVGSGAAVGDVLGRHVGVCDVDGDGRQDIVASGSVDAPGAVPDGGSISIYISSPAGLSPPVVRQGKRLLGGTFLDAPGLDIGSAGFAVGDHDGDGLCDVAVASSIRDREGGAGPGVVLVYAGRADGSVLSEDPVAVYGGNPSTTEPMQFGHALAFGELDGTLGEELVISARYRDTTAANAGWVGVFPGGTFSGTTPVGLDGGIGFAEGTSANASFGESISVAGDVLFVGAPLDGPGTVSRFESFAGSMTPTETLSGAESGARFGTRVVGGDVVVALEARHSDPSAYQVDVPRFVAHDGAAPVGLPVVGVPSRQRWGSSLVAIDLDGDGDRERILGGPDAADPARGGRSGRLAVTDGRSDLTHRLQSQGLGDRRGAALAVGDFDGDGWDDLFVGASDDRRPSVIEDLQDTCGEPTTDAGSVGVFLGGADGVGTTAAFGFYGAESGGLSAMRSGFDADGDGHDDVLVATGGDSGRVVLASGRPSTADAVEICQRALRGTARSGFGSGLAALGDLDGDGCDEVAIGARLADRGLPNEGSVHILWGAGPTCASTVLETSHLRSATAESETGAALAGGRDLDGDGIPDLLVGTPGLAVVGAQTGGIWFVPGSWLGTLTREAVVDGQVDVGVHATLPGAPVAGPAIDGRFGSALALATVDGGSAVAVGAWSGSLGGASGGVGLYRVGPSGLVGSPFLWVAGEDARDGSELGRYLFTLDDRLWIGAPGSSAGGSLANGAVYPFGP